VCIWTVKGEGGADPNAVEVDVRSEVLDLAGDPASGEIVLLVARPGAEAGRDLAVVSEHGRLERRWSLDGDWDRLAISPDSGAVALVARGSRAWAAAADGRLQIHELESAASAVAFAGELVVIATVQELLSLSLTGNVVGRTAWPGQEIALAPGGPTAVFAYDVGRGRATRVFADAKGMLVADMTMLVGRSVPFGWWWDRSWIVTLLKDRLRRWRLPPLKIRPSVPRSDITWVGPT
jgi:hypothetical protein